MHTPETFRFLSSPSRTTLTLAGLLLGGSLIAFGSASGASADDPADGAHGCHGDPATRQARRLEHMRARLTLTDAQVAAVRPILARHALQPGDLRDLPPEERHAARRDVHAAIRAELADVLTAEQLERLDRLHDERHGRGRGHHGRRHGHRDGGMWTHNPEQRLARMTERLELTPAQVERIRPIFVDAAEKHRALHEAHRDERRALRHQIHEAIGEVLTPAQRAKIDAHRRAR